jgi:DNA polymerase-3 subunit epsilon/CBS domain-containing protein
MSPHRHSTPLIALEAVALDTETTGLDARVARIVEIATLGLRGERIIADESFQRLVNPGIAVPPSAAAIHGLTDLDLQNAARFPEVVGELDGILGGATVIGHNIGYDLTILAREYALAGRAWRMPRALDVGPLSRVAMPTLARYSLEALCDWQEIRIERRHRALDDARAAAELFIKLIPLLRARNVRTLAEAEVACAASLEQMPRRLLTGWIPPDRESEAADATATLARLDSFPYRHRVRDVMTAPAVRVAGSLAPRDALEILLEKRISSVLVESSGGRVGILTERDLLRALRDEVSDRPAPRLQDLMRHPLQTVPEEAFIYRAIGRMDRLGIRHLAVDNRRSEIVGVVTPRDLLRQRATAAIALGDEIDSAPDLPALGSAWAKLPWVARSLLDEGAEPENITQVISAEICALSARAAHLSEQRMAAAGRGAPPVPYAVMVLGSAGRGESLLAADQDNAIVYANGAAGGPEDRWFEELATHMCDILDQIGVPYCRGGVMAKNAACRHSVHDWRKAIDSWIERSEPVDLLNVDIFFDGVAVHGDQALADDLFVYAYAQGQRRPRFAALLSALAREWRAPLTIFGGFKKDDQGRVDFKKGGLLPILTGARALAIRYAIKERTTAARLREVAAAAPTIAPSEHVESIIGAHRLLLRAVLEQQLVDRERGLPLSNAVEIRGLSPARQREIHDALGVINLLALILS